MQEQKVRMVEENFVKTVFRRSATRTTHATPRNARIHLNNPKTNAYAMNHNPRRQSAQVTMRTSQ